MSRLNLEFIELTAEDSFKGHHFGKCECDVLHLYDINGKYSGYMGFKDIESCEAFFDSVKV